MQFGDCFVSAYTSWLSRMWGRIISLPFVSFTDANTDERNKIDTSEEHSRDLHTRQIERERERENLYGARRDRENFDVARKESFQLGRTSSETHTSFYFPSIFIVWLLLLYCICSPFVEPSTSNKVVSYSFDEKEREINNMEN